MSKFNIKVLQALITEGFTYVGSSSITAKKSDDGAIVVKEKDLVRYRFQNIDDFKKGYLMCGDVAYMKSVLIGYRAGDIVSFLHNVNPEIFDIDETEVGTSVYSAFVNVVPKKEPGLTSYAFVLFNPEKQGYFTPSRTFCPGESNAQMFNDVIFTEEQKSLISDGCEPHYLYDPKMKENDGLVTIGANEVFQPFRGCLEVTVTRAIGRVTRYFKCGPAALRSLYAQCISNPRVELYRIYSEEG